MDIVVNHGLRDLVGILPLLILFFASLLPITFKLMRGNREPDAAITAVLGAAGFFAALLACLMLCKNAEKTEFLFSKSLVLDGVSYLAAGLVCFAGIVVAALSLNHQSTRGRQFSEYMFLLMNSALGMIVVAWSNDLIVSFIGIEMMSLCLYLIIAMNNESRLSKEAAFKYFILGSLASAVFLYGIALIFGATSLMETSAGTIYIDEILTSAQTLMSESHLFLFGVLFVIIGLCFKVSIAPFHAWTPDVYEGAQTPVTAFMATGVKLVTFVVFMRFLVGNYVTADFNGQLVNILQWLAVLTMVVGNIGAIMQESLKRMLAYSSIAHSGYIMMGLIAASVGGEPIWGATGVSFYVIAYTIMTLGAFGVICILEKSESDIILADDIKGLAKHRPVVALCFSVLLLSLAGIPPTLGFFGKFFLFSAAINQGFFWLAVWAGINSVISVFYYLRPIVNMYMFEGDIKVSNIKFNAGVASVVVLSVLAVVVGIVTQPVYGFVSAAIRGLF